MMSPTSISSPVGRQAEKESLTEITHMEEFAMSDQFENTEEVAPSSRGDYGQLQPVASAYKERGGKRYSVMAKIR
jgi:hypothetical protein